MKPFDKALTELQRKEEAERLQHEKQTREGLEFIAAIKRFPDLLENLKQEDSRVAEYLAQARELKGECIDAIWDQEMADTVFEMVAKNPELFPAQTAQKPQQPAPNKCIELAISKGSKSEYSMFDQQHITSNVNYHICLFTTLDVLFEHRKPKITS